MSKKNDLDNVDGHELLSVAEFARRIKRSPYTVWQRIRNKNMPPGTVFEASEGLRIDVTRWEEANQKAAGLRRVI